MKNEATVDEMFTATNSLLTIIESKLKEVPHQVALKTKDIKDEKIVEDIISREIEKCLVDLNVFIEKIRRSDGK